MDARLQDYLDDKLQAAADLDSLDSLLSNVKKQQDLLKKQLDDAKRDCSDAKQAALNHEESIKQKAQAFQAEQADIDRRLIIVAQSDTTDDAAQKFESSMETLRKLDLAAGYVELLQEVDALRSESLEQLGKSDEAALDAYNRLQKLVADLKPLQEAAESAAPHLSDYIASSVASLRQTIEEAYSKNLQETLRKMNWPKATNTVPLALLDEWELHIGRLLDLQRQDLELKQTSKKDDAEPFPLLPLQVLVHALEQRFTYHFSGNKPTNRLDKPEYFLSHVLDLIREYSPFVQESVQPVILRHFRSFPELFGIPAYIDATTAFITALIPMLKRKLYHVASQLTSQPSLLSHLVQEVIAFDQSLQDQYGYAPTSPDEPWRGLSFFLLTTCGHFDRWLSAEKEFALQRYQTIIESSDAGEIDYDAVSADSPKPTKSAIRVNDLLETITERYRHLSSFTQKVKFLIDIQIEIFDMYFRRLSDSLGAYLTATSSLVRTMHSLSKEDQAELDGVKGLDRLCRIYGSADYLERAMRDWSDDVFFLELWIELDYRAKHHDTPSTANGMSWKAVQDNASSTFNGTGSDGKLEGALFDETASSYRRLRVRSEGVIIETLSSHITSALRPYTTITSWSSLSSSPAVSVSSELDPALRLLSEYLSYLSRATGKATIRRVTRKMCHGIQTYLYSSILSSSRVAFSTSGASQLKTDIEALCMTIDRYTTRGHAEMGLRKLLDAVLLINLPMSVSSSTGTAGAEAATGGAEDDEDAVAAWGDAGDDTTAGDSGSSAEKLSLFMVERQLFLNNESARAVLGDLGVDSLTETEAREVLRKRVELGS